MAVCAAAVAGAAWLPKNKGKARISGGISETGDDRPSDLSGDFMNRVLMKPMAKHFFWFGPT